MRNNDECKWEVCVQFHSLLFCGFKRCSKLVFLGEGNSSNVDFQLWKDLYLTNSINDHAASTVVGALVSEKREKGHWSPDKLQEIRSLGAMHILIKLLPPPRLASAPSTQLRSEPLQTGLSRPGPPPGVHNWLCEVHSWSEHLAFMGGQPFCGSGKFWMSQHLWWHFWVGTPPPLLKDSNKY